MATPRPLLSESVVLDRLRFATKSILGDHIRQTMNVESAYEAELNRMFLILETEVLGKKLPSPSYMSGTTVTFETPSSWWQCFKEDYASTWWLGWLARRWPPKQLLIDKQVTLTVDVQRSALFPEAPSFERSPLGQPILYCSSASAWWQVDGEEHDPYS